MKLQNRFYPGQNILKLDGNWLGRKCYQQKQQLFIAQTILYIKIKIVQSPTRGDLISWHTKAQRISINNKFHILFIAAKL